MINTDTESVLEKAKLNAKEVFILGIDENGNIYSDSSIEDIVKIEKLLSHALDNIYKAIIDVSESKVN